VSTPAQLATELNWQGAPSAGDAELLGMLLDDELERLEPPVRERFLNKLRESAPGAIGEAVIVCQGCGHACLTRYLSGSGSCRCCGQRMLSGDGPKEDSGFGFVLDEYGVGAGPSAEVLDTPAAAPPQDAFAPAPARGLSGSFPLDADNVDWDDLQDEIVARRQAEARAEAERKAAAARAEAERKAREEAERAAREEAERQAREEAERKAREEAERQAREEAERQAREEAERAAREEAERAAREEEERQAREKAEKKRPALGCIAGARAGETIRLPDEGESGEPGFFVRDPLAKPLAFLEAGPGTTVDGKPVSGTVQLELGAVIVHGTEAFVIDETAELGAQTAEAMHLDRNDGKPGGPWPFWNQEVQLGALSSCAVNVVDDGVADVHARMAARFGVVVIEDQSGQAADDGLYVGGQRRPWALLSDGVAFKLGPKGPELIAKKGQARQKAGKKIKAMKPARHNRTVIEVYDAGDQLIRKIFIFVRREVRFGARTTSPEDETRMINEWALLPGPDELAEEIGDKQGALALTREGVDIRCDGGAPMYLNGEVILPAKPQPLRRSFELQVDVGIDFEGRVYRSPSAVERDLGPPRLGMKGGHPVECVRLDRQTTNHSYVFLVRTLRIGSDDLAPLHVPVPGVAKSHCQILFSQGKFLIVTPQEPVMLGDVEMDPGIAFPLEINTDIMIGEARLRFRVVEGDADFQPD